MGTGKLPDSTLESIEVLIPDGALAEIGVFKGDLFKRLCKIAEMRGVIAHAFDSFEGMAEPVDEDAGFYKKGALSNGGIAAFSELLHGCKNYKLHKGFIPDCFKDYRSKEKFAFVYLDVDHYLPTKKALEWIWPRLKDDGILGLDDVFPGRGILAGKAIDEWLLTVSDEYEVIDFNNNQLFIRKL